MTKVADIVARLKKDFPEEIASEGDPVGMQIGSMDADVTKVMTTLDVRPQVVDEAIEKLVQVNPELLNTYPWLKHEYNIDGTRKDETMKLQ